MNHKDELEKLRKENELLKEENKRLKKVEKYLSDDEIFLANYADGLTDLYLPKLIDYFKKKNKIACMITVKPSVVFHYFESANIKSAIWLSWAFASSSHRK